MFLIFVANYYLLLLLLIIIIIRYADKYSLAEYLTNSTLAASLHVFSLLGFNDINTREIIKWNNEDWKSVSLRVIIEEKCVFVKETKREQEGDKQLVTSIEVF